MPPLGYSSPKSWEHIRWTETEGPSTAYLASTLQMCPGYEKQERLRNFHRLQETKETWWLNARWSPGLNLGTDKGY